MEKLGTRSRHCVATATFAVILGSISGCGDDSRDLDSTRDAAADHKRHAAMDAAVDAASRDAQSGDGGLDPNSNVDWSALGKPELIAADFTLAEGPLWDHCHDRLLFTDVEAQTIHTLDLAVDPDADAGVPIGALVTDTAYANGLAFDPKGALLLAEMGGESGGDIARLGADGTRTVIIDRDASDMPFGTIDDIVVRSDGTIYFTDPVFPYATFTAFSTAPRPIYRLPNGGSAAELVQEATTSTPNGIELSPDEKTLYVVSYLLGDVLRFAVAKDGSLTAKDPVVTDLITPDSMCMDAAGNLYVGVSTGLQILSPAGEKLVLIPVTSSRGVTNCTFGGENGRSLYITAWTSLFRVDDMPVVGLDWKKNMRLACE